MAAQDPSPTISFEEATKLFNLVPPFSHDTLTQRYNETRRTWHPSRYAGLTNNPAKYMEMYKKGEAKTKDIQAAYQVLLTYLNSEQAT